MKYIATFYTHAAALMTDRALKKRHVQSRLGPVPRKLSSSCGTCVTYESDNPCFDCMDSDVEGIYAVSDQGYDQLLKNE
jgi:hypothetical protein